MAHLGTLHRPCPLRTLHERYRTSDLPLLRNTPGDGADGQVAFRPPRLTNGRFRPTLARTSLRRSSSTTAPSSYARPLFERASDADAVPGQTEQDFAAIAGAGLNWVRISVPYWAIEVWPGEPFLEGVCWKCEPLRPFLWHTGQPLMQEVGRQTSLRRSSGRANTVSESTSTTMPRRAARTVGTIRPSLARSTSSSASWALPTPSGRSTCVLVLSPSPRRFEADARRYGSTSAP